MAKLQIVTTKMSLRSGKIFGANIDVTLTGAKTGQKRKNPKQCFESDNEDDLPKFSGSTEARTRKPVISMKKKCDLCGKPFRTNVHLKKHMSQHPEPDLFIRPDGLPMTFVMASSTSKVREEMKVMVEEGGGAMVEAPQGDNWVWLLTTSDTFLGHSEAFSTAYVKECVKQGRLLPDLSRYRLGNTGPRYRENPLDVMLGFRGWTDSTPIDIKPKSNVPARDIYDMGLIAEERDMDAFESYLRETESLEEPESMSDLIKNLENEADILDEVQEWARTELAKTEMSEYLPPQFQTSVGKKKHLPKPSKSSLPVRPNSPDEGFESGSEEDEMEKVKVDEDEMEKETQKNFPETSIQDEKCQLDVAKRHKIIQMFPCKYCRKSFKADKGLKSHIKIVHEEASMILTVNKGTFRCIQCLKTFAKENYLKLHMKRCGDNSKRFQCNVCDASFVMNADLKQHKFRHMKHPCFSCKHCEKTFRQKSGLRGHQEIHLREHREHRDQVFPCEECKESFAKTIF